MKIFAETNRFLLREIISSDATGLFELDSDPDVHRYLGNKPLTSINQSEEVIDFIRKQYLENGIGRWAVIDKLNNNFIGWSGLKLVKENINNHTNFYDLGYRLKKSYWRQGIATESAKIAINYGFEKLDLNEIFAAAHIHNQASNHILNKIGFRFINTFTFNQEMHNWYKIERDK